MPTTPARARHYVTTGDGETLPLNQLKSRFTRLTNSTVDVFLSSDGRSIKLGHNWVSSIEKALDDAAMMFVFITPNSRDSRWIYFEAGHAFAKGTILVPVGLFGIDVGRLPPPLSLLMGVNVTSHESLNNIIARVNDEFGCDHPLGFTEADYRVFDPVGPRETVGILGEHVAAIEVLDFKAAKKAPARDWPVPQVYDEIEGSKVIEHANCSIPGAVFKLIGDAPDMPDRPPPDYAFRAYVDPELVRLSMPIVEGIFQKVTQRVGVRLGYTLAITFRPGVNAIREYHLVMSRLYGTKVKLPDETHKFCRYGEVEFFLDYSFAHTTQAIVRPDLHLTTTGASFGEADLAGLLNLLFERGVIWYDGY